MTSHILADLTVLDYDTAATKIVRYLAGMRSRDRKGVGYCYLMPSGEIEMRGDSPSYAKDRERLEPHLIGCYRGMRPSPESIQLIRGDLECAWTHR